MNLTLAIDETLLEKARKLAQRQGLTLNSMIRQYLEQAVGASRNHSLVGELKRLWQQGSGHSRGERWTREDAYSGRL